MTLQATQFLSVQNGLGEGPLWDERRQTLTWVDIENARVYRHAFPTGQTEHVQLPDFITALGFTPGAGFVAAARGGIGLWHWGETEIRPLANPVENHAPARFNDGGVDAQGRFWIGMMGEDRNKLYRFDPDGSLHEMEAGILLSNGLRWSPDGRTMYFVDSLRRVIFAYDFAPEHGAIANRRVVVEIDKRDGVPDGIAVDAEGHIWVAIFNGWCVRRYSPAGELELTVAVPAECPTSCAFGGPNLQDLYITSSRALITPSLAEKQPLAGDLFHIRLPYQGRTENRFRSEF